MMRPDMSIARMPVTSDSSIDLRNAYSATSAFSASLRPVMSCATAYSRRSSRTGLTLHINHLYRPSAHRQRHSKPTGSPADSRRSCSTVATMSPLCTKSSSARPGTCSGAKPSTDSKAGLQRLKMPSALMMQSMSSDRLNSRSRSFSTRTRRWMWARRDHRLHSTMVDRPMIRIAGTARGSWWAPRKAVTRIIRPLPGGSRRTV